MKKEWPYIISQFRIIKSNLIHGRNAAVKDKRGLDVDLYQHSLDELERLKNIVLLLRGF